MHTAAHTPAHTTAAAAAAIAGCVCAVCSGMLVLSVAPTRVVAQPTPAPAPSAREVAPVPGPNGAQLRAKLSTKTEPTPEQPKRRVSYATISLRASPAQPWKRVQRLRIPTEMLGEDYTHTLRAESLGADRGVIVFKASPSDAERRASDKDSFEAYIAFTGRARPTYALVWAGKLDAVDPKEAVALKNVRGDDALELTLVRADARATSCGRSLGSITPRVWDFDLKRFVKTPPTELLTDAYPLIEADWAADHPKTSRFGRIARFITATSDLRDVNLSSTRPVSIPAELSDANLKSAWVEGAAGWGLGEAITARTNAAFPMRALRIFPGHGGDARSYASHASPKQLLLSFSDGQLVRVALPRPTWKQLQSDGALVVPLPKPVKTACMTVTVLEVHPPEAASRKPGPIRGATRTAISEITALIEPDYLSPDDAISAIIEAMIQNNSPSAQRELETLARSLKADVGEAILAAQERELNRPIGDGQPGRLTPLLALLDEREGLIFIKRLLDAPNLRRQYIATLQRTLSFRGRQYVKPLMTIALDPNTSPRARERAVHMLGRVTPVKDIPKLLPLLGQGEPNQRKDIIRALSRADITLAEPLLEHVARAETPAAHDALWALDRIARKTFQNRIGALQGGDRIIACYRKTDHLQTRLRALELLTRVRVDGGAPLLAEILNSDARDELRTLAAQGLELYADPVAIQALSGALDDTSPSVRIKSAGSLRARASLPGVVRAVDAYARAESWTEGLRHAYFILANSSQHDGADYLYAILENGDDRRASLVTNALNKARNHIRPPALSAVIRNTKRADYVRLGAVKALTWSDDPSTDAIFLDILDDEAMPVSLKSASVRALGRRGQPSSRTRLMDLARTASEPRVRMSAIRVLAYTEDPAVLKHLRALRKDAPPRISRALDEAIQVLEARLSVIKLQKRLR